METIDFSWCHNIDCLMLSSPLFVCLQLIGLGLVQFVKLALSHGAI